ncbi:MAG: LPXTG cell wall anchor domain-containing protein [Lachnospiraceae bacterium]|nr:LPXTG cell wall anchor domain-containing protein [Lachnospiraceae bacterium]
MRKLLSGMLVAVMMMTFVSMTALAASDSYIPSPQPDEYLTTAATTTADDGEPTTAASTTAGDEYLPTTEATTAAKNTTDPSKAPKTGDNVSTAYMSALAVIAAAGVVVIARRREENE